MKLELPRFSLPQLDALKGDLVKVLTGSEHRRALLAGAAVVLALGIWYVGIAQPAARRVSTFKAQYESAQLEIRRLGNLSAMAELKAKVEALDARVRAAFERMSRGAQLVQILRQLSADATRYQIDVDTIDVKSGEAGAPSSPGILPKPPEGAAGTAEPGKGAESEKKTKQVEIRTERLELTLSSSYESTARFLDGLKTLPAFVVIDTLKIERDAKIFPNLRVLLTLRVHSIKKLPEELTKI